MDFKTEVDVSLYDFEITSKSGQKRTVPLLRGKTTISWHVEMETRSWGVKGIYSFVPDQVVKAEIEIDDEGEETYTVSLDLHLKDVDSSIRPSDFGTMSPQEISFHRKKWEAL